MSLKDMKATAQLPTVGYKPRRVLVKLFKRGNFKAEYGYDVFDWQDWTGDGVDLALLSLFGFIMAGDTIPTATSSAEFLLERNVEDECVTRHGDLACRAAVGLDGFQRTLRAALPPDYDDNASLYCVKLMFLHRADSTKAAPRLSHLDDVTGMDKAAVLMANFTKK